MRIGNRSVRIQRNSARLDGPLRFCEAELGLSILFDAAENVAGKNVSMQSLRFGHWLDIEFRARESDQTQIGPNGFHALAVQDEKQHHVSLNAFAQDVHREYSSTNIQGGFIAALRG